MSKTNYTQLMKEILVNFSQETDSIKSMRKWMASELMGIEVNKLKTQAEKEEHSPDRKTHRNGYRVRRWDTLAGNIYLMVPKVSKWRLSAVISNPQSEVGLISAIQEDYINSISTQKMRRVLDAMVIDGISAGQVSNLTKSVRKKSIHLENGR